MASGRTLLRTCLLYCALSAALVSTAAAEMLPEPADAESAAEPTWIRPVRGAVRSSPFGVRVHPISHRKKLHAGVDFAARRGARVNAARDGVVIVARWRGGYGRLVVIDHGDGMTSRYAHLGRLAVKKGQWVRAGQKIGTVGSSGAATGPHLHFEIREHRSPIDPVDFLPAVVHRLASK